MGGGGSCGEDLLRLKRKRTTTRWTMMTWTMMTTATDEGRRRPRFLPRWPLTQGAGPRLLPRRLLRGGAESVPSPARAALLGAVPPEQPAPM